MKRTPIAATLLAAGIFVLSLSLGACSDDDGDDDYVAVTGIALSESSITLVAGGEAATLTATVTPDNATDKTVTWTSSNTSVATVEDGVVTPVAEGTATIIARAGEQTAECEVTVKPEGTIVAVTKVELNKTTLELHVEDTETLTATVTPTTATNKAVTWSSSDTGVATVENGKVTAVAEGTATITAKAGDQTAECEVTVVAKGVTIVHVTSVTLNKTTLSLTVGGEETLMATVKPDDATNKTVTWTSSNTGVTTVDSNGKVMAVAAGEATITAKAGNQTAKCEVTVTAAEEATVPVESITLNETELTLNEGGVFQLTATVSPSDATDAEVEWEIDDDTIATLSDTGKVTAKKGGTATITASAGGKSAQCKLTVNAAPEGVRVWFGTSSPDPDAGHTYLNGQVGKIDAKFKEHSDVTISLSATDLVSSVKLHVCKLDSSGPNLYIKGEKGETSDSDYIEFTIEKDCTVSFNSSGCVARVTNDDDFEKTQEKVGLFSEELSAGTYKIYSTESNTACKIQFLIFSEE